MSGFRNVLDNGGFTEVFTPKVVAAATESGANVFPIDWFGRRAFLAQSPQFYKQIMVGVFDRVCEVGPVFRAEPHDTVRHLAEYLSLDAEMGFIHDHRDVMSVLRDVLAAMVDAVADKAQPALGLLGLELPEVPLEIPVVAFDDAQTMIEASTGVRRSASPTCRPVTNDGSARGLAPDTVRVPVRHWLPDGQATVLHAPRPHRPGVVEQLRPAVSRVELVTGGQRLHRYQDYLDALHGQDLDASRDTSKPSATACPHTADSPSGWNAGWHGSPASPTCARSPCSHATDTASRRSDDRNGVGVPCSALRTDRVASRDQAQPSRRPGTQNRAPERQHRITTVGSGWPRPNGMDVSGRGSRAWA